MTQTNTPTASALDAASIVATLERLEARIGERFPDSGLRRVCRELIGTARETAMAAAGLARPYIALRALAVAFAAGWIGATAYVVSRIDWFGLSRRADPLSFTQALDSLVNLLLLAFAAIWFVLSIESRLKRRRAFRGLYRLRSYAHVIDMHQLTKDPTAMLAGGSETPSSPDRRMSHFQLARYLDYCSEMLALTAKLAALYAERSSDTAVMDTVNEIENLTSNLGRKVWQKIMIISELDEGAAA